VRLPKVAATTQAFAAWCEGEVGIGWDRNSQLGKELGEELALKTDQRINGSIFEIWPFSNRATDRWSEDFHGPIRW
jgi:hypothetical protein